MDLQSVKAGDIVGVRHGDETFLAFATYKKPGSLGLNEPDATLLRAGGLPIISKDRWNTVRLDEVSSRDVVAHYSLLKTKSSTEPGRLILAAVRGRRMIARLTERKAPRLWCVEPITANMTYFQVKSTEINRLYVPRVELPADAAAA